MNKTTISWTDLSWNVWGGCRQISPGCANCYAMTSAENKRGILGLPEWLRSHLPLAQATGAAADQNSETDLCELNVGSLARRRVAGRHKRVFDVMNQASWHRLVQCK
jgi:protein gp37